MKNKCTVIQINGLRGLLLVGFAIACLVAGFLIFPAWCCQHAWNYVAGFVLDMPTMELKHGVLLWLIIALVSYVTFFGKSRIAFVSTKTAEFKKPEMMTDEEILKVLEKRILEKRDSDNIVESLEKEEVRK